MKKLLVLAAGILQIPIIKRAREMGYYVVAADGCQTAPGSLFADKFICVDIKDEDRMLKIARQEKIDGVIHPCSEVSMNVMGRLNDELGLAGVSREQAVVATNKHLMRLAFEHAGAPSPKSILTQSAEHAWMTFSESFESDAILKPTRNSGSRGISKVEKDVSKEKFKKLYEKALHESRDNSVLLEQFIEGPEFSVEIIVWEGVVTVLTVTDKKTTDAPHFVELGHNQPSCFPVETVEMVKDAAIRGVKAIGVDKCACHAEVKVFNGRAYIMEIGARMGGDFISTVLTRLSTGVNMIDAAVNCALNIEPDFTPKTESKGVCIRYFCPTPGKLTAIGNLEVLSDPRVYDWEIYRSVGDEIPAVTSSLCRSGHVIVTEENVEKAISYAENLISKVKLTTV